jgi:ATP-binding cassette, subfamily C (CFTR/MRP), member 1
MWFFTFFGIAADYTIGDWTSQENQTEQVWLYSGLSLAFACLTSLSITFRVASTYYFAIRADRKLHETMFEKVANAPINLYYDVTPIGRILNKFSGDLNGLCNFGPMQGAQLARVYLLL